VSLRPLDEALRSAAAAELGSEYHGEDPLLGPTRNPAFGDFQANFAMGLAKRTGRKPRELGEAIAGRLEGHALLASAEVAGPGFVNLRLRDAALAGLVGEMAGDERLGVPGADPPETVVVDYASPNLAKEMHVGHLRSSIIGDALCRVLSLLGHRVVRQNHLGDWGTQFGMLLEHLIESNGARADGAAPRISDLDALYREAKRRDDGEPDFARRARERVVALQGGEAESMELWRLLIEESVRHMDQVLGRLGVLLERGDLKPESFYNDRLDRVAVDLEAGGLATESQGALCVFLSEEEPPLILRKSDGGYGYAATDLAAVRHRVDDLGALRIVYVVDARQRDHFGQCFAVARKAGWVPASVRLEHVAFGAVLGPDGKPFKTREGGTVKLAALLDEAVERARRVIDEKGADLSDAEKDRVAEVVGIGSVKYADLSGDRVKDYVFDWDRMLALDGNTAPYLINAYVRIRSIFRRGGLDPETARGGAIPVGDAAERALALQLLEWPETVARVERTLQPHHLCTHLHALATGYHQFYERCSVLNAETPELRTERLALSSLVAETLRQGLELLGIGVVERM
jgi:arginyl-tRNA synthetase